MGFPATKILKKFTYRDYITWPDDERWELIDGIAYNMTPAPSRKHQDISGNIYYMLRSFLEGKPCKIYAAPFDVLLQESEENTSDIGTVVQPDRFAVCDDCKLKSNYCLGSPDLVVEIVSPATTYKDTKNKFALYEKHKVNGYWIVYPEEAVIEVYCHDGKKYTSPKTFKDKMTLKSAVFPDFEMMLTKVFQSTPC